MAIKLNGAGVTHANSLISGGHIDFDSAWSFSAADGDALLGSGGDDWTAYGGFFLGLNDAEPEKTKGRFEYPFGKDGKIYASAIRAIRGRASAQNEDDIFASAGHLLDSINAKAPKAAPSGMHRAYATLQIKAVDPVNRTITGIATTPTPDRMGDIVESEGAIFSLPIPLLWQHDADCPVGNVIDAKVAPSGITVTCQFVANTGQPTLDDRLDQAWAMVQSGLVRGLSIGFMPKETAQIEGSWSYRYLQWEWLELSAVTIPANSDATINTIKRADREVMRSKGLVSARPVVRLSAAAAAPKAGATAPVVTTVKGNTMNIAERIASLETTRAAKASAATAIMEKAATAGLTLNEQEQTEFDDISAEIDAIDAELKRCHTVERLQAGSATAVRGPAGVTTVETGSAARVPATVRTVETLDKGIRFARAVRCLAMGQLFKGANALAIAQQRYANDDAVIRVVKAAVDAATVGNEDWAGALVGAETTVFADFADFLRPLTIIGQFGTTGIGGVSIPALRTVPFRTRLLGQTGGGSGYWVGEAKPIPLTRADFQGTTLTPLKVASIMVASMEQLRDSSPSADVALRNDLGKALAARMDMDFIDPNKSASNNISPASITHGVSPIASSGNDIVAVRADITALIDQFLAQSNQVANGVFVMPQRTANALSQMVTTLDVPAFPQMTPRGGILSGYPVIASEYVLVDSNGAHVFFVNADDVYFADDGETTVDFSAEASLEMSDAPGQDAGQGTGASMVSMWQTGTVAYRAIRTVNWAARVGRSPVAALNDVNWGAAVS